MHKLNRTKIVALAAAISLLTSAFSFYVQGDELAYDSTSDPLVSLSYINEVVLPKYDAQLAALSARITALENNVVGLTQSNAALAAENTTLKTQLASYAERMTALEASNAALVKTTTELAENPGEAYQVICLAKGKKLLADSPCEIILRSGTAIVVSITTNGVNDLSDGTELLNAANAPLFHCLLVPRGGDGRGIQVTSDEAYVMVRGGYQIVD